MDGLRRWAAGIGLLSFAGACMPWDAAPGVVAMPAPVLVPSVANYAAGVSELGACWHRSLPGAVPTEVSVSPAGIAVVGDFAHAIDFGRGPTATTSPREGAVFARDAFVARYAPGGGLKWGRTFGAQFDDRGTGVAIDATGSTTVVGTFVGTINLGAGVRPFQGAPPRGTAGFIASYDADGRPRWEAIHGERNSIAGDGIAVDGAGNLTVVGASRDSVGFVVRFAPDGTLRWRRHFAQDERAHTQVHTVAVDPVGNVYATGSLSGGASDLGGGTRRVEDEAVAAFVVGYTSAGEHRWDRVFGAPWTIPTEIAVGPRGEVTVAGSSFSRDTDEGQIFVLHFEADGSRAWERRIDATLSYAEDIATDDDGAVYVCGQFEERIDLGGGVRRAGDDDTAFVVSYARDGRYRWDRTFAATDPMRDGERRVGRSVASGVAVGGDGTLVVTGSYVGDLDLGDGDRLASAPGTRNGFIVALAPRCE